MNSENRQHTSPLTIPSSPRSTRDTTPSPKIPISTSFGASNISGTPEKVAFSFNRERAPSLLAERLEEDLRLEQERYNQAFAEELETEHRSSSISISNQSENAEIFRDIDSDDQSDLPFPFEPENEEEVPAQLIPFYPIIACHLLNANHPAFANLDYYESLLLIEQKNQAVHEELRAHFSHTGPRR